MHIQYKKGKDGMYRTSFMDYRGKQIPVRAHTIPELKQKLKQRMEKDRELEKGCVVPDNINMQKWSEKYLQTYCSHLKGDNLTRTKGFIKNHIVKALGTRQLCKLKPIYLQEFMNGLTLSRDTTKKIATVLKKMLDKAVENGLIAENPADNLIIPNTDEPATHRAITEEERKMLLETVKTFEHGDWIMLLLCSGLRPSESCALDGKDIADGLISVTKALDGWTDELKPPKSKAGIRKVPITNQLAPFLPKREPFEPLFQKPDGSRATKVTMRAWWDDFLKAMGKPQEILPIMRMYDLRHTYCTDLEKAGVPINVARMLMGHSKIEVTAKYYTHTGMDMILEAGEKLNKRDIG